MGWGWGGSGVGQEVLFPRGGCWGGGLEAQHALHLMSLDLSSLPVADPGGGVRGAMAPLACKNRPKKMAAERGSATGLLHTVKPLHLPHACAR